MLVLTRGLSQKIIINDNIEIIVLRIKGKQQVRLGIVAPRKISVYREEIYSAASEKDYLRYQAL